MNQVHQTYINQDIKLNMLQEGNLCNRYIIKNNCNEGAFQVDRIELLYKNKIKTFFTIVFIILTFGIYGILLVWVPQIKKSSFYSKININSKTYKNDIKKVKQDLTHVQLFIKSQDKPQNQNSFNKNQQKNEVRQPDVLIEKVIDNSYFKFLNLKYEISVDPNTIYFTPLRTEEQQLTFNEIQQKYLQDKFEGYLTLFQIQERQSQFGQCQLETKKPNFFAYMGSQLISIPFVMQYISDIFWIARGLFFIAILVSGISIIFTIVNYYAFILPSYKKLQQKIKINNKVKVLRALNNTVMEQQIDSVDLVPGDRIILEQFHKLPCDAILIKGNVHMDEAALTGETIPIPKFPVSENINIQEKINFEEHKRYILCEGTKVTSIQNHHCEALVLRTGFITSKGQLLRSVIFPQKENQDLYISFMKYICVAICILLVTYPYYWHLLSKGGLADSEIFPLLIGFLVQMIPPALPILISINFSGSIRRLSKHKIYAQEPQKLIQGQSISTMCFDKTGTITTDEICLEKILDQQFQEIDINDDNQNNQILKWFLGSCHSVICGEQKQESEEEEQNLEGDNIELEMVRCAKAKLNKDGTVITQDGKIIKVLKTYEFDSLVARMTTVVEIKDIQNAQNNKYFIFTKGAPEILTTQCCKKDNILYNYDTKLNQLNFQGYRTLALAQKEITQEEAYNIVKYKQIRDIIENNLNYIGILGFVNPLKSDAFEVINNLTKGLYNCVIISGDNPLTTIACGLKVNLFNTNVQKEIKNLVLLDISQQGNLQVEVIDLVKLQTHEKYEKIMIQNLQEMQNYDNFVATGKFLNAFKEHQLNLSNQQYTIFHHILTYKTKIFARQKPEQKAQIIDLFQQNGIRCGMIGDGANDCAAIKQADLGISYQFCDASFASPFQYQKTDLQVVPILIQDAKCCMINIIDGFRLNNYSVFILYFCLYFCSIEITQLNNKQTQWVMMLTQTPIFPMLAFSKPLDHKKDLMRVSSIDNFFNLDHILNVIQVNIFSVIAFVGGYICLISQSWHEELDKSDKKDNELFINDPNDLQSTMVIICAYMNIFTYFSLVHGRPLRQSLHHQKVLFIYMLIYLFMQISVSITMPYNAQKGMLDLVQLDLQFRVQITVICLFCGLGILITGYILNRKFGVKQKFKQFQKECKNNILQYKLKSENN